jgi:hypothetical protein
VNRLPSAYRSTFDAMLASVAQTSADSSVPLVPFWPLVGGRYEGDLLVIGRSVNGWIDDWTVGDLRNDAIRGAAVDRMRVDAEDHPDRLAWVTDLWGNRSGYSTARSAFWRTLRRIAANDGVPAGDWPSHLAWTNLYKVSPAAGWNPGGDLQRAQRSFAAELLRMELEAIRPHRVVAFTGRTWLSPFESGLKLTLQLREGLVEAIGTDGDCAWVVAKHPMTKPETQFVTDVLGAFRELGTPIS